MLMSIKTTIIVTCDICKGNLHDGDLYIDATYYGYTFHPTCWEEINGPTVAKTLQLDDIHPVRIENK
jgi:hypothetical protein